MTNTVQTTKVMAVQEPGYENVWSIQDEAGSTVARLTINDDAEVWAKRLVNAFNASNIADASLLDRAAATIDAAHVPGTDTARDLRAAARELVDGNPYVECSGCGWFGHTFAEPGADFALCPECGESGTVVWH